MTQLAQPILSDLGLDLDRVHWGMAGRRGLLQVFIDRAGGVSVDHCADASRRLSDALDADDTLAVPFTLEVSSPGLTRPLSGEADFERHAGRLACVKLRVAPDGRYTLVGRIAAVADGSIRLELQGGATRFVPLTDVSRATLEVETAGKVEAAGGPGGSTGGRSAGRRS